MVSSYLQLLRRRYRGRLDSDADDFIDYAVDGAARMRDLIDDLLTYSRAGREHPFEPVDTRAVAERAAEAARAQTGGAEVDIAIGALPTLPGDPLELGQLFQNLVGNAVKFVPEGRTPEVEIGADRDGDHWRFTISDNGIGLQPDHAERIFGMFQRLHTREEYPGTGIGLAIAKKVVEDNEGDVRLTREALREADVNVELIVARDGEEALAFLRGESAVRPAIVLLDLNLPKLDGLEVLEEVKGDPELRHTPVIMLTTSSSSRDVLACYERGVNCYVVKPLELDEFTALVQAINRFWLGLVELP